MALKRTQIYLDPESDIALKQLAQKTGLSAAEHIRRAVRAYVGQHQAGTTDEETDPLLDLIGICDDPQGPKDASLHHDQYVYGRQS